MTNISIRKLSLAEAAPIFSWLTSYAFSETPPTRTPERFSERFAHTDGYNTYLALFKGSQAAACAGAGPMRQNVRGNLVESAGIFMVATNPAQRRKGYSHLVLKELFRQLREQGFGFSTLYPFKESFYQRLGYTNWPPPIIAEINIRALAPLLKQEFNSDLEQQEFINAGDQYDQFLARYQQQKHGMSVFTQRGAPDPERDKAWMLISRINGELDGIMVYSLLGDSPTKFKFNVLRFYYLSPVSRYQFLKWIALHIDQTNRVSISLPPFEQPHTWLSDLEIKPGIPNINPMGRILDIEKLNGVPVGAGQFTARIIDTTCPWNEGLWQFASQDGKLSVTKANKADCTLSIQGISSLAFGNTPPKEFQFHGWGEIPAKVQAHMNSLFPPAIPYLHEYF